MTRATPDAAPVMVTSDQLAALVRQIFERLGVPPSDARIAADVLIYADLRGIDSHGVQLQMQSVYIPGLQAGTINATPNVRVVAESLTTSVIDGDRGLGHPIAHRAMLRAIDKARASGSGFVAVRGSTHFGAAGYYAMLAAERQMVGLAMTNAPSRVLPTHGREPMLGTNPIAIAAPGGREPPVVIDLATSTTSAGRLRLSERSGEPIPASWAADANGHPTTDPAVAVHNNKLLPLGGAAETGGYKGYALAVAVDIFAGLLSGAGFSAALERPVVGHFFGAFDIGAFGSVDTFTTMIDEMARGLRATPPSDPPQTVLVPGDPEHHQLARRSKHGIPLPAISYEFLIDTARALGIDAGA